ncbi:uncharacterized protein METZ01_LOCUS379152 [marine metagenome]|uniref:Uncharacterized protein n=1 Tax=marine metagenome TaxID=408172 RepID=A0A382TY19_9ZZZZ
MFLVLIRIQDLLLKDQPHTLEQTTPEPGVILNY